MSNIIPHSAPSENVTIRKMPGSLKARIYKEAGRRQANGETGYNRDGINAGQIISEVTAAELGVILEKPPEKPLSKLAQRTESSGFSLILPETMLKKIDDEKSRFFFGKNNFILRAIEQDKTFKHLANAADLMDVSQEKTRSHTTSLPIKTKEALLKKAGERMLNGEIGADGGPVTLSRIVQEYLSYDFEVKLPDLTRITDDNPIYAILVRMRIPLKKLMEADAKSKGLSANEWLKDVIDKRVPK